MLNSKSFRSRILFIALALTSTAALTGCGDDPAPAVTASAAVSPLVVPISLNTLATPKVVSGADHACRLFSDGSVKCWGLNNDGQLGQGSITNFGDLPNQISTMNSINLGTGRYAVDLTAGAAHTCALLNDGGVKCWGLNNYGQLGLGDTLNRGVNSGEMGNFLNEVALGSNRHAVSIAAGNYFNCALLDNGDVKCWGQNFVGQLGLGDVTNRGDLPGQMGDNLGATFLGTHRTAVAIAAGTYHACAILDNGTAKCWGLNDSGQLGQGNTGTMFYIGVNPTDMETLNPIDFGSDRMPVAMAAGDRFSCALLDNGTVKCWGYNAYGQLGQDSNSNIGDLPNEMGNNLLSMELGFQRTAISITAGLGHACALLDDGSLKCWGLNSSGQLGQESTSDIGSSFGDMESLTAIDLGTGRIATAISAGFDFTCAILDNGDTKCFGGNAVGQLGQGDTAYRGYAAGQMGDNLLPIQF